MTEVIEEEKVIKPDYQKLLSFNYALDTDKMNLILKERYEKKDGKGKNANGTGEYGWRDLGYFQSLTHMADYIVRHELMKERDIVEFRDVILQIETLRDEIVDHINERITVTKG